MDAFNSSVISCAGLTHRFTANASSVTGGAQLSYPDAVAGSTWTLAAVAAASGAPVSAFKGAAMLFANATAASAVEAYDAVQKAWVLRNSAGLALRPGAAPCSLGASGRGFSVAVWFRVDDAGASNAAPGAVLQLTLRAGASANVTLTLVSAAAQGAAVSLVARRVGGAATSTDTDEAVSSSSDDFGTAATQPNAGLASVGKWQHAVFSYDAAGVHDGLYWNGRAANATAANLILGAALFGAKPPYGPLLGGALGFDASGGTSPLWGAVGDVQLYDFAMSPQMAQGLYAGQLAMCMPLPGSSSSGLTRAQLIAVVICSFIGFSAVIGLIVYAVKAAYRPPPLKKAYRAEDA